MAKSCCPTCGQPTDESTHTLSKALVRLLYFAYKGAKLRPFQPSRIQVNGEPWTHSQRCNFQKLQYWNFIEQHVTATNYRKRGWWRVTAKGAEFLHGAIAVKKKAITFNKQLRRHEGDEVVIKEVTGGWQYRGDYAEQARPQQLPDPQQPTMFGGAPS